MDTKKLRKYYEQNKANVFNNLDETSKFLEPHNSKI